jgi:hypothetical protein
MLKFMLIYIRHKVLKIQELKIKYTFNFL